MCVQHNKSTVCQRNIIQTFSNMGGSNWGQCVYFYSQFLENSEISGLQHSTPLIHTSRKKSFIGSCFTHHINGNTICYSSTRSRNIKISFIPSSLLLVSDIRLRAFQELRIKRMTMHKFQSRLMGWEIKRKQDNSQVKLEKSLSQKSNQTLPTRWVYHPQKSKIQKAVAK